jgi:putative oxidoreductase
MSLGRVLLRTTVGGLFVAHGTQKLFGWFDGYGIDNTAQMFGSIGLRPGKAHAVAAGIAETGGGAALVLGAATPLASSVLISTMLTAIRTVHGRNGPWAQSQGWEYNAVLIAAAAAVADAGPGSPSVDAALGNELEGPAWAAFALALGALGAAGVQAVSSLFPEPLPDGDAPDAGSSEDAASSEGTPSSGDAPADSDGDGPAAT